MLTGNNDPIGGMDTVTITLSGAFASTQVGLGTYKRKTFTFTTTGTSLTVTVSGTVSYAQLETGPQATSWMKTLGASATRAAEVTTGSGIIYTNVTDSTPVWSNATSYVSGARVRYNYKIWESLVNSNLNNTPGVDPTKWLLIGADNIHAAFDNQVSTSSKATTKLIYVLKIGNIDSVALINLSAVTARLAVYDPTAGVVARQIAGLSGLAVFDWYQYFFYDPLIVRTQVVFTDLPTYANSYITIELEGNPGDTVSVAQIICGLIENIGGTQYGATSGIVDYSIKQTDEFGTVTFVQRNFSKRLSTQVFVDNVNINRVQRFLYSIRATPVVWIGADDPLLEEAMVVYGFYKDFSTDIGYPSFSLCSIEIEGLT